MTALARPLLDLLAALVTLGAAAALPLLLVLGLRGWVRRDPNPVQAPRSATGLSGADLRAALPGSRAPAAPARNDHGPVVLARPPRQISRGRRASAEVGTVCCPLPR